MKIFCILRIDLDIERNTLLHSPHSNAVCSMFVNKLNRACFFKEKILQRYRDEFFFLI